MSETTNTSSHTGFLGWVERTGNKLPDPVFIFLYLILALIAVSVIAALTGLTAQHPTRLDADGNALTIVSKSLLSAENIQKLWVDMPKTFTHFHPLGYVLVVMLGAGVAERSGFFSACMRAAVRNTPTSLLTPVVALVAMLGNHAADAGYVVLIPLAGILFAAAGRHPLAGIAAAFAGVSGGFSANFSPGQLDALLFGITEEAVSASSLDPSWTANIAGNWYFISVMTLLFLPIIWYVTDKVIEPRLGTWNADQGELGDQFKDEDTDLSAEQKRGLKMAGLAALGIVALWIFMTIGPGTPLIQEDACPAGSIEAGTCSVHKTLAPFYKSLVGGFFALFLACGWFFGKASGTISNHKDLVAMMSEAMKDMGYYLVLSFVAAHFIAMFAWSNLGLISAVHGADAIQSTGLPLPIVIGLLIIFSAILNLFVGSASAKWALLAPILVPMLMLLGISPEAATAAYRVGDGATNIITPLMVYFPLILIFAKRWDKNFGIGSLTALMLPYSIWMLILGTLLMVIWVFTGFALGPDAPVSYQLPTG